MVRRAGIHAALWLCCCAYSMGGSNFAKCQTPPDLVVKFQPVDIIDVILWLVLQPGVVSQREIKG
jgi:hypothetical protein